MHPYVYPKLTTIPSSVTESLNRKQAITATNPPLLNSQRELAESVWGSNKFLLQVNRRLPCLESLTFFHLSPHQSGICSGRSLLLTQNLQSERVCFFKAEIALSADNKACYQWEHSFRKMEINGGFNKVCRDN